MEQQDQQPIQEKTETKAPIKTNWKYIAIAIVVVLGLLAGIFLIFLFVQYEQLRQPRIPRGELPPRIIPPPSGEKLEDPFRGSSAELTAGWQTYRNDEYGFEVKYPEDFQLNEEKEEITITSKKVAKCKTGASGIVTEGTYAELQLGFMYHSGMSYETIWKKIFGFNFDENSYDGIKEIGGRNAYYFYQTAEMPIGKKIYLVRQTDKHALQIDIDFPGIIFDCKPFLMHGDDAEKLGDQILSTFRFVENR